MAKVLVFLFHRAVLNNDGNLTGSLMDENLHGDGIHI